MQILINDIKMPIVHTKDEVIAAAREIVRSDCVSAKNYQIYRQSIDARRKNNIHYVYGVTAETNDNVISGGRIRKFEDTAELEVKRKPLKTRPVVVGMGPCGLFAAWILTLSGNPPIILERGGDVDSRTEAVKRFWKTGRLDPNSNVQFGEGGAGTFSDGKLNTRISDPKQRFVLKTFTDFGAPRDIMYKAKPHIGTDKLCGTIKNMRKRLIELGAEVRFNTSLTDIRLENGALCGIELSNGEFLDCESLILAIGHSSRDTYERLCERKLALEPKPFAIGVRIEHSQRFIDRLQYGGAEGLPPADYRVVYNGGRRSCYSFCMCPGGTVVNASSENEMLAVNGMSCYARDGRNANSALVVNVRPEDFEPGILGGMEFQRKYERLAFRLGGGDGKAPIQLAEDFIDDVPTGEIGGVSPTVTSGFKLAELKNCLPQFVTDTLRSGLCDFERRMKGFAGGGAVLTGIESRTSAPVRILRGENMQSINASGIYPAGEGAGYAGGIVSAAVDGIRAAISLIDND